MEREELTVAAGVGVPPAASGEYSPGLSFEQTLFNLLPTTALILLSPFYLNHYYRHSVRVLSGPVLWAKLAASLALATLEIRSYRALRSITASPMDGGLAPPAASCVAALCVVFVVYAEHRRALQSSALTGIYLLITLLSDISRAKTYFDEVPAYKETLCGLAIGTAALKLVLLALLEIPKRWQFIDLDLRENIGAEASSGFWNRSFVLWAYSTLFLGFRTIIDVRDLGRLSPEFSSKSLSARLEHSLHQGNKRSQYYLVRACLSCFCTEFLLAIPPQLCLTVFTFCQPLLLYYVITYVSQEGSSKLATIALVGISGLIYFGIAASRSVFKHVNSRLITMMRGAIIPLIIRKSLVSKPAANETVAVTLMNSDLDAITNGIYAFHDAWRSYVEVGLGLYLLREVLPDAVSAIVVVVTVGSILNLLAGEISSFYFSAWRKSIEKRISQTAKVLSQMKVIKTIGIDGATSQLLHDLRRSELSSFRAVRVVGALESLISMSLFTWMQVIAFSQMLFQTPFPAVLVPAEVFTTLAIVTLTGYPLASVLSKHADLTRALGGARQIQAHLLSQETQSITPGAVEDDITLFSTRQKAAEPDTIGRTIELIGAYISPFIGIEPILSNVWCSFNRSQTTAILGPTGSGKTTLLRALLGEALLCLGQIFRKNCTIAYCGQEVWMRDLSVRSNIIGPNPYDPVMYEVAINACGLNLDLQQLPNGDSFVVGINGAKLSGGQKQRIALARALYERAKVVLLDDIYSGLDSATAQDIHGRLFGPKGVLQKSGATVVFVTRCASFIKVADQAIILDGSGTITVHSEPSKLKLASGFVAQLDCNSESQVTEAEGSQSAPGAVTLHEATLLENDLVRQRGDRSLYRYFLGPTSAWKVALLLFTTVGVVANDLFTEVFIRIWLENDGGEQYFDTYKTIVVSNCLMTFLTLCLWFVVIMPQNSLKLHKLLLNSVTSTTLSHFTSMDMGSVSRLFGEDMTLLTHHIPRELYRITYWGSDILFSTCIVVSGIHYPVIILMFLALVLFVVIAFFLRTSRQLRLLDAEATTPLHTIVTEVASGAEHIRAFGWEQSLNEEVVRALDSAQKPYYYKFAIQRWVELAADFTNLGLALLLVYFATSITEGATPAAVGLSMLSLATYGVKLNKVVEILVGLETSMVCVARLRAFVYGTPVEEQGHESPPPRWPASGHIVLSDVTSQYSECDRVPVLNNVRETIYPGQKVGISGRSGTGKTSLIMTMLRLTKYTGTITIDGVDISTIPSSELRSRITTVSQDTVKLDGTVRENLLPYLGQIKDKTITDVIIFEATDQVGMTEIIEGRGGLDLALSEMRFSQGQMQLLSLARAIIHHTCTQSRVVLLDEPTSSLDLETDDKIQTVIRDEFLDCTILIISHREDSLWDSDVRLEVSNKRVHRIAAPKHPPKRLAHLF